MSCDTFVALPPFTDGCVIFGKNSDRPPTEVQEVVYVGPEDHSSGAQLECTYLTIPQVAHTHAVVLSKPAWMWGTEMGANEHGVCIGNEAVWTKLASDADKEEKLLGMDLVRLGLERSQTSREAVDVITGLLETHGQGGPCYDDPAKSHVLYHNSFIIADGVEAWVLETAGKQWAAEKLAAGVRNLSNLLTIGTKIDLMSDGLKSKLTEEKLWNPDDGQLDFSKVVSADPDTGITCPGSESPEHRYQSGKALMESYKQGTFDVSSMMAILRNEESGICRRGQISSASVGSQVSVIYPPLSGKPNCHWFTGTPNPARSLFKPFVFTHNVEPLVLTMSPEVPDDPAKKSPRFERPVDRRHELYLAHQQLQPLADNCTNPDLWNLLMDMEASCVKEMEDFLNCYTPEKEPELHNLFQDAVDSEIKFYPRTIRLN